MNKMSFYVFCGTCQFSENSKRIRDIY